MAAASAEAKWVDDPKCLWVVEYIGEDDMDTDDEDFDAEPPATILLQLVPTRDAARRLIRRLITADREERRAMEAEVEREQVAEPAAALRPRASPTDLSEDAADDDDDDDADDGEQDEDEEDDDDGEENWEPEYPAEEVYSGYRMTLMRVGEFYGWHDTAAAPVTKFSH
jgi:hypothetical protein